MSNYRVVVIDHAFVEESHRARWKLLAEDYPVDVTLLVPRRWRSDWLREDVIYNVDPVSADGYEVVPLPTTSKRRWMQYVFLAPDLQFRSIDPDLIHVQYSEMAWIHHQAITYRNLWARKAKLTFFTMNALGVPRKKWHERLRWRHLKRNADAAFGHYPGCRDSLREAGFEKPIYLQTSYGVDETLFYPDSIERRNVREQLGFEDRFVVGFVGRLTTDKGLDDLLEALPPDGVDWSLLLVGDGEMREAVENWAAEAGFEDRVHLTGYVAQDQVPRYIRAMDAFVIGSKTRDNWVDTFPRTVVQAMACEVPVVGSDSGAIPFQVGDAGLIVPEGDSEAIQRQLEQLAADESFRQQLGAAGREECQSRFSQRALADNFYEILRQLVEGEVSAHQGGPHVQTEAY